MSVELSKAQTESFKWPLHCSGCYLSAAATAASFTKHCWPCTWGGWWWWWWWPRAGSPGWGGWPLASARDWGSSGRTASAARGCASRGRAAGRTGTSCWTWPWTRCGQSRVSIPAAPANRRPVFTWRSWCWRWAARGRGPGRAPAPCSTGCGRGWGDWGPALCCCPCTTYCHYHTITISSTCLLPTK